MLKHTKRILGIILSLSLVLSGVIYTPSKTNADTNDGYYEISYYKNNNTYPQKEGYTFAGWYTDSSCTNVYNEKSGRAYAKFINSKVLRVVFQFATDYSAVRFISSLDSCDYSGVGFIISGEYDGHYVTTKKRMSKVLYSAIKAEDYIVRPPQVFHSTSKYFATYTISGMESDKGRVSSWSVSPILVTLDGTEVMGEQNAYSNSSQTFTTNNEKLVSLKVNSNKQLVAETELNNPHLKDLFIKSSKAYQSSPTTSLNTTVTNKGTTSTFTSQTLTPDQLQNKYYIYDGNGTKLFGPYYITNPEDFSNNNNSPVTTKSKKGLKLCTNDQEINMAKDLNCSHACIDVGLGLCYGNNQGSYEYKYGGKTYHFDAVCINDYINAVKKYNQAGMSVTFVCFTQFCNSHDDLMYINKSNYISYEDTVPSGKIGKDDVHPVAFNTKEGREGLEAVLNCLAEKCTQNGCFVENWICGNEIQGQHLGSYNFAGSLKWTDYAQLNADMFRMFNTAIKSHSTKAKTYLSFDPKWNLRDSNSRVYDYDDSKRTFCSGRWLLDQINTDLNKEGFVHFDVALHPYIENWTTVNEWWNETDKADNTTNTESFYHLVERTRIKNINKIAKYINNKYDGARIILSEQGFIGYKNNLSTDADKKNFEIKQATAVAAAYYEIEASNYIDSFDYHRLKDYAGEGALGLYGLNDTGLAKYNIYKQNPNAHTNDEYNPSNIYDNPSNYKERYSAHLFRYMDTVHYYKYDRFASFYGGASISHWADYPNLNTNKLTKNPRKVGNYLSPELVDYQIIYNGGDTYKLNLYIEAGNRILDVYAPTWTTSLNQSDIVWSHGTFDVKTETGGGKTMYHNYTFTIRKKDLPQATHLYFKDVKINDIPEGDYVITNNKNVLIGTLPTYTVK